MNYLVVHTHVLNVIHTQLVLGRSKIVFEVEVLVVELEAEFLVVELWELVAFVGFLHLETDVLF